jgi:homopolymeric O-antigen transport system permease protein
MLNDEYQHRILRPDSRMREGSIEAMRNLIGEIWTFRSHIKIVFKEQFRASYSGTGLGIFWSYVLPLVPLTVYWALSRLRVFPNFEGVDGATFLTFGVTLWFLLAGCVQMPIQIVQSRNKEAMKTAFPLSASIVSGFAQLLFDTLVRCVLVIVVVATTQSWPTWQGLMLPVALFPALLLFVGVGLLLGILNVIYNDVSRVVTILLQYGIFVSGVIFPLYDTGLLSTLNLFNPFAVFIDACRAIVFRGAIENFSAYLAMTGLALIMFLLACRAFFIMEYRIRGIT